MKSKRVPDRVHVVRPPEATEYVTAPDGRSIEIVRTLAQISEKLKRSEAERYELLAELREYRKALNALEDKTSRTEKAYLAIEHKIQTQGQGENELSARQARFEKTLKDTEEKLVKTAAGQALIDKRISEYDTKYTALTQRIDETANEQAQINRQIEKVGQEKARMMRKVERLEEIAMETQESLRARALVLLTDQSAAVQSGMPQLSAWSDADSDPVGTPWYRKSVKMQSAGMASMVVAALLLGWAINQVQQPEVPQIALLENGGLARLNFDENRWEAIVAEDKKAAAPSATLEQVPAEETAAATDLPQPIVTETFEEEAAADAADAEDIGALAPEAGAPEETAIVEDLHGADTVQTPNAEKVLNYNDDEILSALEKDPEQLASDLNEIAPAVTEALELDEPAAPAPTAAMRNFDEVAYVQDPAVIKSVLAEKKAGSVTARIAPDASLPKLVAAIEQKAFEGNAEAQHDLAAIYTAGHGGVKQDFDRAAMWFREAADNGVANARYNLGVLYHQGLGVKRDLNRALYWYREAATLSHPEAQYNLGIAYIEGIGTDYNAPMAASFFERAANSGIMEAAYNLGLIYENGLLGEPDTNRALLWYKIAADQGSQDAKNAIKQLSKSLQIGPEDVDAVVDRMQKINVEQTGRRAGPTKTTARNG